jgi:hypothetical protein
VEKVLPEIVTTGKNGRKKVAYMEFVPVLIEAMKEQQGIYDDRLEKQQTTIEKQQAVINDLLSKVDALQKEVKLINGLAMAKTD